LERVADHIGIMDRGRLVTTARLEDLLQTTKRVQVVFDQAAPPPDFGIPGSRRCRIEGPVVTAVVNITNEEQLAQIRAMPGTRINIFPMNLEEIFIEWFDRSGADAESALPVAPDLKNLNRN
jgi:ABC-type multidrug transport system ATPase subunit